MAKYNLYPPSILENDDISCEVQRFFIFLGNLGGLESVQIAETTYVTNPLKSFQPSPLPLGINCHLQIKIWFKSLHELGNVISNREWQCNNLFAEIYANHRHGTQLSHLHQFLHLNVCHLYGSMFP